MKVRIAVIVAAGWGTRFLPITKTIPKEMLPLINRPIIQYAVEEAVGSGIEHIILVTSQSKRAMEDYFDRAFDLEFFLKSKGDAKALEETCRPAEMADISAVRQKEQLGLGHAVLTVKSMTGNEPFVVILPDDIIDSRAPAVKQLIAVYDRHQASVVGVQRIKPEDTIRYGVIEPEKVDERVYRVMSLREKPLPQEAPSDLGVVGRYILTPEIFDAIQSTPPGKGKEIQLTDALQLLLRKHPIYALEFEGTRYDVGTPLGWLEANIAFGLKNPDIGPALTESLRRIVQPCDAEMCSVVHCCSDEREAGKG